MPKGLTEIRTLENFRERLPAMLADTSAVGPSGAPVGFCVLKGDELYRLYVSREARGSGVAQALVADAEGRVGGKGVSPGWLVWAIGKHRDGRCVAQGG